MDQAINGVNLEISVSDKTNISGLANGTHTNGFYEPSTEELERELPMVYDGQVPLGDVLSRVVQAIYAELSELAETQVYIPDLLDLSLIITTEQHAQHVGHCSKTNFSRLGGEDQKTGRQTLRCCKVGTGCGYGSEMHGG
jgi:hypothetical protein